MAANVSGLTSTSSVTWMWSFRSSITLTVAWFASSRQRRFTILHTLRHFLLGRPFAFVFVFDECRDRIALGLEQHKHLLDRRVAFTPRRVRSVVLLAIFQEQ